MTSSVDNWTRPYYRAGGGDALLFYVVYGPRPKEFSLSGSEYRVDGIPDEIEINYYGPSSDPEVVDSFRSGYLWEKFQRANATLANEVANQSECLIVRATVSDPSDLDYLRNAIGIITWCLDAGCIAVFDPQMFEWWTPSGWKEQIFEPAAPVPRQQVVILISEDEQGTEWLHTRGMRKFGRPDLSVRRVSASLRDGVIDLLERFIELQAFGGIIDEGQEIKMNSLPSGLICRHEGSLDDPDFNNVHVEIG